MSSAESNDEFLRRLSRQFTASRWQEAFETMHPVFVSFMKDMAWLPIAFGNSWQR